MRVQSSLIPYTTHHASSPLRAPLLLRFPHAQLRSEAQLERRGARASSCRGCGARTTTSTSLPDRWIKLGGAVPVDVRTPHLFVVVPTIEWSTDGPFTAPPSFSERYWSLVLSLLACTRTTLLSQPTPLPSPPSLPWGTSSSIVTP